MPIHTGAFWMDTRRGSGGRRQFCLPKFAHVPQKFTENNHWMLPVVKLENRPRTTCSDSSNHSLYLLKLLSSS